MSFLDGLRPYFVAENAESTHYWTYDPPVHLKIPTDYLPQLWEDYCYAVERGDALHLAEMNRPVCALIIEFNLVLDPQHANHRLRIGEVHPIVAEIQEFLRAELEI